MKILFVHEVNYLRKPIFEMHEIPENLSQLGHDIAFVDFAEDFSINVSKKANFVKGRVLGGQCIALYTQPCLLPGVLGRLLATAMFPLFFRKVLQEFMPDIIVSYSVPTSGWQALRIARKKRIPYVYRALDVSHKIRQTAFEPLIKVAERLVYANSDLVSANNPALAEYCISMGSQPSRTKVDLPPLDLRHFQTAQQPPRSLGRDVGIRPGSKIIVYMGSFFYFSGLLEVVRSLPYHEEFQLLLIGGGEQEEQLKSEVMKLGLSSKVLFTGFVDYEQLPTYLRLADVAINSMVPSLVSDKALPNKVLQYMASGLPVVSTRLEGLRSVFPDAKGIRYVDSPSAILSECADLIADREFPLIGGLNNSVIGKTFRKADSIKGFEATLKKIIGDTGK